MKRMMIAAMLLLGTVSVFAADEKSEVESVKIKKEEKQKAAVCTATVEGSLKVMGSGFQITCSATSDKNCRDAAREAKSCVEEVKKLLLSMF